MFVGKGLPGSFTGNGISSKGKGGPAALLRKVLQLRCKMVSCKNILRLKNNLSNKNVIAENVRDSILTKILCLPQYHP